MLLYSTTIRRSISEIELARGGPIISHLFFSDDCLLYLRADVRECFAIKNILKDYELAFDQCINFNKSDCFFSPNVSYDFRSYLYQILGVNRGANLGKYLGLRADKPFE